MEVLERLKQSPMILTACEGSSGSLDIIERRGRGVSDWGQKWGGVRVFQVCANFARSKAPRDVLVDNLDLHSIKDMLLLVKVEIKRCIDRLEVV
jgi:hypothetical protein